jgi:hypothetical protein
MCAEVRGPELVMCTLHIHTQQKQTRSCSTLNSTSLLRPYIISSRPHTQTSRTCSTRRVRRRAPCCLEKSQKSAWKKRKTQYTKDASVEEARLLAHHIGLGSTLTCFSSEPILKLIYSIESACLLANHTTQDLTMCMCVCVHIYLIYVCMYVCMYVCIYVCMYVCMYIYIYIYIYI